MKLSVITFRHMPYSADLALEVKQCIESTHALHRELERCRVIIESTSLEQSASRQLGVQIRYQLSDGEIAITHTHSTRGSRSAVRAAFLNGEQALRAWLEKRAVSLQ